MKRLVNAKAIRLRVCVKVTVIIRVTARAGPREVTSQNEGEPPRIPTLETPCVPTLKRICTNIITGLRMIVMIQHLARTIKYVFLYNTFGTRLFMMCKNEIEL